MIPLNRKPTTLAHLGIDWRNVAICAGERARLADNERAGHEYQSAQTAWRLAELSRDPFPISVADGIRHYGKVPAWDNLLIDRGHHIDQSVGSDVVTLPAYLDEAVSDEDKGWRGKVCAYLGAVDDRNRPYDSRPLEISGEHDLNGDIFAAVFYPADAPDWLLSADCFVAIDGTLYNIGDSTIADCDILESRISWWVSDLSDGDSIPEIDSETQRYCAGYSGDPTDALRRDLRGDSEPVWHHGLGCFVGRLRYWPEPVRLYPSAPIYGG